MTNDSQEESRVLLVTFSDILANALRGKLRVLINNTPRLAERLEVHSMNAIGERLFELNIGHPRIVAREIIRQYISEAAEACRGHNFKLGFLLGEWEDIVDAWQLDSWEDHDEYIAAQPNQTQYRQETFAGRLEQRIPRGNHGRRVVMKHKADQSEAAKLLKTHGFRCGSPGDLHLHIYRNADCPSTESCVRCQVIHHWVSWQCGGVAGIKITSGESQ